MVRVKFMICFSFFLWYILCGKCENPVINTPLGKIRGSILTTRLGKNIYSFTSIRYAKAPINNLRFQPPVPVDKWNEVYDATQPGPVCPQPGNKNSSEDCLMLNVYTNKISLETSDFNRPVLVFFHPGGFTYFTGASYLFGPQYLLDQDIILVSANYRLGSLGFLSTGTKEAPGNNGFKDQTVVLRWVRDNIKSFGGNPHMVTLAGYSAGALSNTLHLVSPMSKGLFHRVIIMSASVLSQAYLSTNQIHLARKQARLLNCSDDTPVNIFSCLNTKSAKEIVDTVPGFAEFGVDPIIEWTAVIEPDFGQERFIIEHPITSMLYERFEKVPVMAGISQHEFGYVAYNLNSTYLDLLTNRYKEVLPYFFGYERYTNRSNEISAALKQFYYGDATVENISRLGVDHLYADGVTGFPVNRAVKLISDKNTEHTYYYYFTYKGRYSFSDFSSNGTKIDGPVHHDELMYLFYMAAWFPYINRDDPEWATVDKMITLWTNFVKTGNPTPGHSSILLNNIEWLPYSKSNPIYLDIGEQLVLKKNLHEDRYKKWEALFPVSDHL